MILVFAESKNGKLKKNAFELASLASQKAKEVNSQAVAVVIGNCEQTEELGKYGISKVYHYENDDLNDFDDHAYRDLIVGLAEEVGANLILLSHTSTGKALCGRLAVRYKADCVSAINGITVIDGKLKFIKPVFSGKAYAHYSSAADRVVASLIPNSVTFRSTEGTAAVEKRSDTFERSAVEIVSRDVISGTVPLPEAELVVSAGRGMKGPENWGIIEELADVLGATTACSRPVSDTGWRPHHEHVGQTGIAIRPNLYFAIGISGAIQHLAGVNNSKVIVVINKDPEAPFFKAADYGVCADLFDVVPKLTEAFRRFKADN
jgi:electron transfer flavoprotein alpha subunit